MYWGDGCDNGKKKKKTKNNLPVFDLSISLVY